MKLYNNIFILFIFILSFTLSHAQVSGDVDCTSSTYIKTDFCVCMSDQTTQYLKNNNLTSLDNLPNTTKINFLANTKSTCLQTAQQKENAAAQAARQQQQQAQQNNGGSDSGSSGADLQQIAGQLSKVAPLLVAGTTNGANSAVAATNTNSGGGTAAQASGNSSGSAAGSSSTSNSTPGSDLSKPANGVSPNASLQPSSNNADGEKSPANATESDKAQTNTDSSATAQQTDPSSPSSSEVGTSPESAGTQADISTGAEAASNTTPFVDTTIKNNIPDLTEPAQGVAKAANLQPTAPESEITTSAQNQDAELKKQIESAFNQKSTLTTGGMSKPFTSTVSALETLKTKVDSYINSTKPTCTKASNTADFLCINSKSPGVNAVKGLMDAAGPVLAIAGAAQKACSNTADVTKLASMGLFAAKGACVGAKMFCDSSCGTAKTSISTILASVNQLNASIQQDNTSGTTTCNATYPPPYENPQPCLTEVSNKKTAAEQIQKTLQTALQKENVPATPGTSPYLAMKCQMNTKDIALLGIQAAGLLASSMGGKKCAEKLAASGSSGISTAQYCDKSENASTQFCKCQKNNSAEGCPGAVASSINLSKDQAGTNIKSLAGNSGFASGYTPSGVHTGVGGTTTGGLGSGSTSLDPSTMAATGSNGASASGTGTSDSQNGSGVSAPIGSTGTILKAINDAKKWGFDSLGFGSGGGSGGGGSAGKSSGPNGALSQKQSDAINRKIASEKLAAEVSSASGKSNWEKVRQRYLMQNSTFLNGQ